MNIVQCVLFIKAYLFIHFNRKLRKKNRRATKVRLINTSHDPPQSSIMSVGCLDLPGRAEVDWRWWRWSWCSCRCVSCLLHSELQPTKARLYLHSTLVVFTQDCRAVNISARERERENDSCTLSPLAPLLLWNLVFTFTFGQLIEFKLYFHYMAWQQRLFIHYCETEMNVERNYYLNILKCLIRSMFLMILSEMIYLLLLLLFCDHLFAQIQYRNH